MQNISQTEFCCVHLRERAISLYYALPSVADPGGGGGPRGPGPPGPQI